MSGETRFCPVPECTAPLRPGLLMCGRHWARVPLPLQREVYAAWRAHRLVMRAVLRGEFGSASSRRVARDAYHEVAERAVALASDPTRVVGM